MEQEAKMDREELNLNSEAVITDITIGYKFFKRVIDIVCSLAGLLLLSIYINKVRVRWTYNIFAR